MRKMFFTLMLLVMVTGAFAGSDSTKFIQKIKCGIITGASASSNFESIEKPFNFGNILLGNVTFVTPRTYHNLMYSPGNNSISVLSGYLLKKNWDIYVVYAKSLNKNKNYLGFGVEKMVKAGDVVCFLFSEYGIDFMGENTLSVGVLISIQTVLFKRK